MKIKSMSRTDPNKRGGTLYEASRNLTEYNQQLRSRGASGDIPASTSPTVSVPKAKAGTAPSGTRIQSDYEAAQRANARRNYEYRQTTGQLPSQPGENQELSHRRDVVRDRQANYLQTGGTIGSAQNQVFQRSIDAIDAEIARRQNDRQKEARTRAKNTADALKYNQKTFEKRAKEAKKQYGEDSDEYRAAQQRADEATKAVWEAGLPWQMRVANYADAVGGRLVGTAPQLAATLTRPPENEIRDNEFSRRYQAMNNWLQSAADYFYDVSAQGKAALKYGLGKVGSTVADVAVAGGEMLSDAAMNMILPGSGMAARGLRAGASGANEAYHAGATPGQEFMYGAATAGVEMLTEKMFDGMAKVYGAGAADEITEGIVRRLAETNGGRTLARILINTPGEGIEEVVSDLANPFIKYIYDNGAALQENYGTGEGFKSMMQEAGYDFLVGAILGVGGAAASVTNGEAAARNARLALQDDFIAQMSTGDGSSFFIEPHSGQTTRFGVEQYGDTWWGYAIDGQGKTYWQNGYKSRSAAERGTAVAASDWIVEQAANPENRANDADVRARDEQRAETAAENPGSTIADDQAVEIQKTLQDSGAKNSSLAQAVKLSGIVDKILNGDTSLSNREILSLDLYHNGGLLDIVEQKTGEKIDTSSNKKILAGIRSIIEQRAERFEAEDTQKTAQAAAATTQSETQILPQIEQEAATDVQEAVLADEAQEPAVQTEIPVVDSIPDNTEKPGQASARTKSPILPKAEMDAYNAGREERLEKARQKGAEKRARVKKEKEEAARRESAGKQAEETAESQPIVNNKSVAIPNGNGYTEEKQSGYSYLSDRLERGYDRVDADGLRYFITRTSDGYRVNIDRIKGSDGYVTDARSRIYSGGPFADRADAVDDLLSVARVNFYPEEQREKEDWEDIDGNAIRAELERRRASGESPVDNMLRQAEQIEAKQFSIKKGDKDNGTETVEEVFDGGTVRAVGSGRPDAGGLLDGVSSEDVRQDAQRGDADPDATAESGGTSGLARGYAAPGNDGVRSSGLHQGGSVRTSPGGIKEDANGQKETVSDPGHAESTGGISQADTGAKGSRRSREVATEPTSQSAEAAAEETTEPATTEEQIAEKADLGNQEQPKGSNFVIGSKGQKLPTTPKARYKANADAIKTLRAIMADGRLATAEEQEILAKYTGWGGLSDVFDEKKTDWAKEYKQLKKLLDDGEYKTAKGSILDAYYTEPAIIQGMYNGLAKLGFTGGRLLEPSAGVGRFIGAMPAEMLGGVKSWTAVELDKITGNIAKYLYPNADVRVQGFESAKIPDNYMDVVIGNVPFGNFGVADKSYPAAITKSIHNYFIAKSLDKARPGGIVAVITSRETLDATGEAARSYFMKQADLIGAIRLPNTAFQGTGTNVISDILVFKKREPGTAYKGEDFLISEAHYLNSGSWSSGDPYAAVNEYFDAHPEMVLGKAKNTGSRYGQTLTYDPLDSKVSLQKQIENAFDRIKVKMDYTAQPTQEEIRAEIKAGAGKGKHGTMVSKGGKLYKNDGGNLVEAKNIKQADVQRMTDVLGIRDAARALLDLQLDDGGAPAIAKARKQLNTLYDAFVKKHGYLNSPKNKKLVQEDADSPFVLALEEYNKDTMEAKKAAIFTKNTVTPIVTVTHADTVEEALIVSMNETGTVDVGRIAQLTGQQADDVRREMLERGLAFKNRNGDLEAAELYLAGNVRAKLRDAEAMAEGDSDYQRNVEALRKVIPADIPADEIKVRLGATWVPDTVYSAFAGEMLGGAGMTWKSGQRVPAIEVKYNRLVGKFFVEVNDAWLRNRPENTSTWGTSDYPFVGGRNNIMEAALNNKTVSVWRSVGDNKRVLDKQATAAAQEKLEKVLAEFQRWLWSDDTRRTELGGLYNDLFNNTVTPKYDGSHLTVNGSNPNIKMLPHQKNAVQRIINSGGNTLLAHRVGAGKTYEMAAAAMKLRQLGIVKKPLFAVPKHLVAQWGNEFLSYFPAAKILVLDQKDFTPANRKLFANRIATGDYDAVIMSYEQFGMVPMSRTNQEAFYQDQIDVLEMAILESKRASGKKDPSVRDMERSKKSFEAKLKKLGDGKKDVDNIDFEQLGVDALFVDEAHNFKNLFYTTKMQGVADLGDKDGSQRAFDLYMKVRYLQRLNGGRGIVFATATPVMNSVVELYTMQRYLQGDLLDAKGLTNFDAWANQFGDVVTIRKMKTGGNGYELKQSLSKYKNLAEMQQMFRGFADVIVDAADLPYLKIPKMKTGKRIVVECDPSPFQEQFMEELGRRAEALRGAGKGGSEDHIFKVFDDGKKISYTQRMVDSSLPYEDGGKIMKCVENVYRIWNDTKADKGTQLIFCDRGTPGGAEAERGVSLYEDIKNLLVGLGVPDSEIAFIHDATSDEAKSKLFKDVNDGTVRVLIGSTSKMGTGMNAQKRIVALHELNAPDRPGDLEQNEGRGLRQGNMNDEVEVYAYVTKKTFDSRQWDNLKRKATFIHQIMAGEYNGREAEGDGDLALSAAEISAIASDNPLIMEQFEVSEKIANLENLERAHTKEVAQAKQRIVKAQQEIVRDEEYIERYRSDLASRQDTAGDKFRIVLGGKTYTERKAAGEAFVALAKKALNISDPTEINTKVGSFAGFDLYVTSKGDMLLRGKAQYRGTVNMQSATGTITALENVPRRLENMIAATETRLSENRASLSKLEQTINTPFARAEELIAARVREAEILAELNPPSEQALAAAEDEGDVESMVDYDVTNDAAPHPERWEAQRVGSPDKAPMRLSEIVEKIRHDLGLNITSGHVRGAGVRGQYDQRNKGIRSKIVNDLPTISHELGHALSHRYGLLSNSLSAEMKAELENALGEMKDGYSKKQWLSEGLAEYIRKFLQNRETAAIDYPVFTEHFLNSLSAKDAALIEQLADEINAYYSLDADTATSSVRLREEGRPDARTLGEKIRDKADVLYQAWTDSNHGIKLFDEETGADTYKLATNAAYSDAIAGQVIIGDLTDANGKYISGGLTAALHGINLKDKEAYRLFGEYLIVRHGPERLAEGMRIFADDRKNSKEFMDRRAMELEQQHPEFKEAADRLYQFQRDCRQAWLVDTGLISADTAEQWDKRWQYYVPLNRAVSMKSRGIGAKRGFANQKSPIKKARGSGLDIIHPVDNIINNIVLMVNAGVRNNVMRKITDEAERLGADASLLEHVPTPMKREQFRAADLKEALKDTVDNSEMTAEDKMFMLDTIGSISDVLEQFSRGKAYGDVITVMKDGKPEFWKINDPLLLESITSMSPARQAGVLDVFARVSRFMTANITGRNLVWNIFSNLPRDIMTFAAYSKEKNPWRGLTSVASAWGDRFKKPDKQSALYKEFLALGGGRVSAYTSDKNIAESARKHIARGGRVDWWNPLEIIDFVADTVENGPRFATYKMMRENGLTEQEAFYEAMDITVNFRRGGRLSRDVNKIVPFFNAGVQGLDKFRRWISAADAPSSYREKTIVKRAGMYITASIILAAIEYAINHRNDDDEMYYHQLSAYTKHSYWCIPMGDGKFFCIPKPRELGVPASFFADVLNRAVDGDPYAFNAFYEYAANSLLPSVASDVAQLDLYGAIGNLGLIGIVAYMAANRDFLGRPIESTAMRNLLPEDRFTEKTAITSKWLGRAFSKIPGAPDELKSPAMWDYFLSNTLGGFQKANKALFPVGSENRDWSLGVKNTWVKDAQYSTDLVNWMYDRAEASSQEKRSNPDDPAIAVRAKMDDNLKSFYSSYYALAKNEKETEESTSARQTVLNVISEYRLAADYESPSGAEEVVRGVAERLDDTSLLPGVMNTYVKNRKGEKITLSAPDYVKYQMDYLRIYWEGVERLANRNMSDSRLAESIQKAKTTAKNVATGNALSRIGEKSSVWGDA